MCLTPFLPRAAWSWVDPFGQVDAALCTIIDILDEDIDGERPSWREGLRSKWLWAKKIKTILFKSIFSKMTTGFGSSFFPCLSNCFLFWTRGGNRYFFDLQPMAGGKQTRCSRESCSQSFYRSLLELMDPKDNNTCSTYWTNNTDQGFQLGVPFAGGF